MLPALSFGALRRTDLRRQWDREKGRLDAGCGDHRMPIFQNLQGVWIELLMRAVETACKDLRIVWVAAKYRERRGVAQ